VLAVVRDGDVRKFNEDNLVRVLDKNDQLVVIREAQVRDGDNREQVLGPAGTYSSGD